MKLQLILLACALCAVGVFTQFVQDDVQYVPVRVRVPGLLGETGGYYCKYGAPTNMCVLKASNGD